MSIFYNRIEIGFPKLPSDLEDYLGSLGFEKMAGSSGGDEGAGEDLVMKSYCSKEIIIRYLESSCDSKLVRKMDNVGGFFIEGQMSITTFLTGNDEDLKEQRRIALEIGGKYAAIVYCTEKDEILYLPKIIKKERVPRNRIRNWERIY